jgi:hypothetical protein
MKRAIVTLLVAFHSLSHATAQSTFAGSECVPGGGVTALPNCDKMNDQVAKCTNTKTEDLFNCYCNQDMFNLIFEYV